MATTATPTTPERVTFSTVRDLGADPDAMQQLRNGLANAWSTAADPEMDELYRRLDADAVAEHPGVFAYEEQVIDAAIAEIAPQVAAMLEAAIARRLPWTWEPER